jgi:hypothetical protein
MSKEQFIGFLKGNVEKYLWRFDTKGVKDSMSAEEKALVRYENLGKGEFYLKRLMSLHTPSGIGVPQYEEMEMKND